MAERLRKEGKTFFFEKKQQETFQNLSRDVASGEPK
jgi:hypothetical protein